MLKFAKDHDEEVGSQTTVDTLSDDEEKAKAMANNNFLYLVAVNTYSSLIVFLFHLISVESLMSIGLSVGSAYYTYETAGNKTSFDGSIMDWVLLSFAVITPISTALSMAFSRRERALDNIAIIRSSLLELYSAHATWHRGPPTIGAASSSKLKGRLPPWLEHADKTSEEIIGICGDLSRYLLLPTSTRARHKITASGMREAAETRSVASRLDESIVVRFGRLTELCEILKREGLPSTEAARIRSWERYVMEALEKLCMIKKYRTPQALRSFARLFSIFLPPFYAPYYAQMARQLNSFGTAIAFSVMTSLALTALFETVSQIEDPFVRTSVLDGIDVHSELVDDLKPRLVALRNHYFPTARELPKANRSQSSSHKSDAISVASLRSMRFLLE